MTGKDKEEPKFVVGFRPLADRTKLMDQSFPEAKLNDCDVTIQQYAMGLRYADRLESFGYAASISSWIRTFDTVVIASSSTVILNDRLETYKVGCRPNIKWVK